MDTLYFRKKLKIWNEQSNKRALVWRGEKDAYRVWLREIILQQTRVEQGESYYLAFLEKYPTLNDFANASLDDLYRLWQGLGYYTRCKNMWISAQFIKTNYESQFPNSYEKIIALKGIGKYTAAAIVSFAFNLPYAVVDGNVVRILSRYFGINSPFKTLKEKKIYEDYANQILDKKNNATFNQAMMDFGATICKPQKPLCSECPVKNKCFAYQQNKVNLYPPRPKKNVLKERFFHFIMFENKENILITKRQQKDIWQNLYTPILIENNQKSLPENLINDWKLIRISEHFKQVLSHQKINGFFYFGKINKQISSQFIEYEIIKVAKSEIKNFTFPKIIISFFKKYNYL